jgi:uncharacterized repeat protein (TIGR03803 family)
MANLRRFRSLTLGLSMGAATATLALAILLVVTVVASPAAQAQTFSVLHSFTGGGDGADPRAGLTIDAAGDFYGTTRDGGSFGYGTVFKLTHRSSGWVLTPLYSFAGGDDGASPDGTVIFGPDGSLYGTTSLGGGGNCGGQGCGTVFKLRIPATACKSAICPWTETVIYRFMGGSDGEGPAYADLIFDKVGNLYGTTRFGGAASGGTVYELTPSGGGWTESVIYSFNNSPDGYFPNSGVILDDAGNLYGTTYYGGTDGVGTVYQLTPSGSGWAENIIHSFPGSGEDGVVPACGLIFDQLGNLYGATPAGGSGGGGTVFELTPSGGNWIFAVLYNFNAGTGPYASLTMDRAGSLYGTTFTVGADGYGSVFKLTFSGGGWTYTDLYDFTGGNDGGNPESKPVFDANGNLYGTARLGGTYGNGVVWELTP